MFLGLQKVYVKAGCSELRAHVGVCKVPSNKTDFGAPPAHEEAHKQRREPPQSQGTSSRVQYPGFRSERLDAGHHTGVLLLLQAMFLMQDVRGELKAGPRLRLEVFWLGAAEGSNFRLWRGDHEYESKELQERSMRVGRCPYENWSSFLDKAKT